MHTRLFLFLSIVLLLVPMIVATPAPPRNEYDAAHAAQTTEDFVKKLGQLKVRPIGVQSSAMLPLKPPVISLGYYFGSFDGYVADAFDLRQNQGPFFAITSQGGSYENNDLTALLKSKTKPAPVRWPYLYGFVYERAASYLYGIVALPAASADLDLTRLVEPQPLYITNRIPLDLLTNGQIFTPTYSAGSILTGRTTGYTQVAKIASPLPPFGGQFPNFIKTVETMHYGFSNAKGEFKVDQQPYDAFFKKHVADGRAVFAAVIYDGTDSSQLRPVCHVAFEKIQTQKQTFVHLLSESDGSAIRFKSLGVQVGPACAIRTLQPEELANYLKAAEVVRRGKPLSFVPGNCPAERTATTPCVQDRFFTYHMNANPSGGFSIMATDMTDGTPYLAQLVSSGTVASGPSIPKSSASDSANKPA